MQSDGERYSRIRRKEGEGTIAFASPKACRMNPLQNTLFPAPTAPFTKHTTPLGDGSGTGNAAFWSPRREKCLGGWSRIFAANSAPALSSAEALEQVRRTRCIPDSLAVVKVLVFLKVFEWMMRRNSLRGVRVGCGGLVRRGCGWVGGGLGSVYACVVYGMGLVNGVRCLMSMVSDRMRSLLVVRGVTRLAGGKRVSMKHVRSLQLLELEISARVFLAFYYLLEDSGG